MAGFDARASHSSLKILFLFDANVEEQYRKLSWTHNYLGSIIFSLLVTNFVADIKKRRKVKTSFASEEVYTFMFLLNERKL